ncbi:MAG TPA: cytochrome-c oxidase, cbb3-type subunit III [Burkholderiaceae bacterium]|jgi:cytochrome c oxidase cbb3-type subunit 3|nr:cytochrome-c oxidase, cbb3-type subunit III [Burkholderiaceae bacterium]
MADFTSGFWSPFIAIVTIASIVACLLLLVLNSKKQAKTADNTTGHVWDGDLREANNPLPRWWSGLFVITIVFSLIYLWLYPGLGASAGSLKWSQAGQYEAEAKALADEMAPLYAKFQGKPVPELIGDAQARAIGERLFLNNCAQCHGSDGRGAKGFPNLTDGDWLYGNAPEQIVETIAKGRNGVMPPLGAAVGGAAEVEQLAQYVLSLSGGATDPVKAELGKGKFAVCAACHGPDGKGNQALGAPNLTDKVWLHGGGQQAVVAMINNGKDNMMPAWSGKLTDGQIHVLASYVLGLSQRAPAAASK